MRTTWEMQCKGLWGLSLGFPSAAYSLHFISWLTKCVAIHLEPTEVLWSTLLTSTPHNSQKKFFAAKIPVSCRRMLLEARLETSSMVFPHQGESIHPTEPTNCPLGQPEGPASHAVPKQAHKLAVSFLCATPWLCEALRSLPTPCLNGTRSCCIGAPGHVCLLWGRPQPANALVTLARTGIDNKNLKDFFHTEITASDLHMVCSVQT